MSITCREDLLKKREEAQSEIKSYTCRILVCSGTGCMASGAQKIYDQNQVLHIYHPFSFKTDWNLLKKILYIGIPN